MSLSTLAALLGSFTGFVLAGWVLVQNRDQKVRWAFAGGMVFLALEAVFSYFCLRAGSSIDLILWERWRLACLGGATAPWACFSLIYARGEKEPASWPMRLSLLALALVPAYLALFHFEDFVISISPSEYGFIPTLALGPWASLLHGVVLAGSILTLLNLERTYRASVGTLRWRIKFMILGLSVIMITRLLTTTHSLLFEVLNPRLDNLNSAALLLGGVLLGRALLRSGHFEIELYPSQSVLRNSITIILVGAYLVVAAILAKFFSTVGTDFNVPRAAVLLVIALVVLLVALSSDRVRLIILRFVSRHFQRPLYDYRAIWRQFTETTRSPRSQEEVGRKVIHAVAEILQVQSASLWVLDEQARTFRPIASTALPSAQSASVPPTADESQVLIPILMSNGEPFPFHENKDAWATILRRCLPVEFNNADYRVATSLLHQGQPIGMLLIGDRVGGIELRTQDLDMLKCAGDHITTALLNVQLSRQLIQARELEAFQAMAAFFVHDLKNAASTLNLMLPNLRNYWDTPGFKDDALRGIHKTVDHINTLVKRLTQLRGELDVTPTPTALGPYLEELLSTLKPSQGHTLCHELADLPVCLIDADQFRKVVINLVLNAYEATPAGGQVRVKATTEKGWVMLEVADTGKGMPAEFIQHSLFKPFQTTKKGGLGIGLFHTRMIVEAHGGRISVESKPGAGTTFRVSLPVRSPTTPPPDGQN